MFSEERKELVEGFSSIAIDALSALGYNLNERVSLLSRALDSLENGLDDSKSTAQFEIIKTSIRRIIRNEKLLNSKNSTEKLESLLTQVTELGDFVGDEYQIILDYWKERDSNYN